MDPHPFLLFFARYFEANRPLLLNYCLLLDISKKMAHPFVYYCLFLDILMQMDPYFIDNSMQIQFNILLILEGSTVFWFIFQSKCLLSKRKKKKHISIFFCPFVEKKWTQICILHTYYFLLDI